MSSLGGSTYKVTETTVKLSETQYVYNYLLWHVLHVICTLAIGDHRDTRVMDESQVQLTTRTGLK